jgi:hypothetical protein
LATFVVFPFGSARTARFSAAGAVLVFDRFAVVVRAACALIVAVLEDAVLDDAALAVGVFAARVRRTCARVSPMPRMICWGVAAYAPDQM